MLNKEFKVGEVFQFGLIKLKVEKANYGVLKDYKCNGCEFECLSCDFYFYDSYIGQCNAGLREDKTDVIFKKVED